MLIQTKDATFKYGDRVVFDGVNVEINEGDAIGLVGENGIGKSTLLNCLCGELALFSGNVSRSSLLSVGYLKQNPDFVSSNTVFEEMMTVFSDQIKLLDDINKTAEMLADGLAVEDKYNRLLSKADAEDAYNVEVKVKTVLNGMGLKNFYDCVVNTLSGGEKTKVALCKLLLICPKLLILDEPTNHLDYKTLDWLEGFLTEKKTTLVIVSHDRYFLDKVCNKIWDFERKNIVCYNGNYTKFKTLKAERQMVQDRTFKRQQEEIAKLTDYVERNKARASTANMAKSREKQLEKMEIVEGAEKEKRPPSFEFGFSSAPSEKVLAVKNLSASFDGRTVLDGVDLEVMRGDKIALIGLNGTGKSTLLKNVVNFTPQNAGKILFGKNVRYGYYDQENLNLNPELRVLDQLWFDNTKKSQTEIRNLLARVLFTQNEVVEKKVRMLSGGERAKLGLCMIMAKDCNLLLLDEPTNHLDLPSREALEQALSRYEGTILFVSHDRYLINSVATSVAELEDGKISLYQGNYDEFWAQKKQQIQPVSPSKTKPVEQKPSNYRSKQQRADETNRNKKLKELEKRITELESEIAMLNDEMALPEVAGDYNALKPVLESLEKANSSLEQSLTEWEQLQTEIG